MTLFFRLLRTEIDTKGARLAEQVQAINVGKPGSDTFAFEPSGFMHIPGSPFAYWVSQGILSLFRNFPPLQSEGREACYGLSTKYDFRFLRLRWEINPASVGKVWFPFLKGGSFSKYYCDIHLLLDWENDGHRLKSFADQKTLELFGVSSWSRWINNWDKYFRPGITWPSRTAGFSARIMQKGCIFGSKGPAVFVPTDDQEVLLNLLAIMNTSIFDSLLKLQLARTQLAQSYEVGIIQQTPLPDPAHAPMKLRQLALEAYYQTRCLDSAQETAGVFSLPSLVFNRQFSVEDSCSVAGDVHLASKARLESIQVQIDGTVSRLYGLSPNAVATDAEMAKSDEESGIEPADDNGENELDMPIEEVDLKNETRNLLMWCVGCAFGRWDIRYALDPTLLPRLQEPFDPLPPCAPGMLIGTDGLPASKSNIISEAWLRARPNVITVPDVTMLAANGSTLTTDHYPLSIEWDGIIPDDEMHSSDIIRSVREVLQILWRDRADTIEQEACQILGVPSLREYFRQPRHFLDFHIKRYSRSRRKAPIYWLLQSKNRNYGIWLYYHRLTPDTLYRVAREYVDPKVRLEEQRLNDLRGNLSELKRTAPRAREREISAQIDLLDEIKNFQKTVDRVALLNLKPDLNDGVLLNIAPLHELVPWKEAHNVWKELMEGKYAWSSISQQLRAKGLVKG